MKEAVHAVHEEDSTQIISKKYNIPFSTLQRRIKKNFTVNGKHPTFSPAEKCMAENITLLVKLFYVLSPLEIHHAAYVYGGNIMFSKVLTGRTSWHEKIGYMDQKSFNNYSSTRQPVLIV